MAHSDNQPGSDKPGATNSAKGRPAGLATQEGSSAPTKVKKDDDTVRDSIIGTDQGHRSANVSWGAIFAGVFIFLAIMVIFGLVSAALGLGDAGGVAVGIWSVIGMLVSLAAAGYVAGALAVRSGLLHGLVTWATSLVALLLLVGWVGASVLGTVGGALGGIAQGAAGAASSSEVSGAAQDAAENVDPEQVDQAAQDAQDAVGQATDDIAAGTWWGVAGLVIGAAVAGFAGIAGARSAHTRGTEVQRGNARHDR